MLLLAEMTKAIVGVMVGLLLVVAMLVGLTVAIYLVVRKKGTAKAHLSSAQCMLFLACVACALEEKQYVVCYEKFLLVLFFSIHTVNLEFFIVKKILWLL